MGGRQPTDPSPLSVEQEAELGRRVMSAYRRMLRAVILSPAASEALDRIAEEVQAGRRELGDVLMAPNGGPADLGALDALARAAARCHRLASAKGRGPQKNLSGTAQRLIEQAGLLEASYGLVEELVSAHLDAARWARRGEPLEAITREVEAARHEARAAQAVLIHSHLRFVAAVARGYRGRGVDYPDLVQEGNLGLIRAAEKFDPRMGCRFNTYAMYWIRAMLQGSIANQARTIRVPVRRLQKYSRIARTQRGLAAQLGREPTRQELAESLKVTAAEVDEALDLPQDALSVSALSGVDEPDIGFDRVEDRTQAGPFNTLAETRRRSDTRALLSVLSPREQLVVRLRYGIGERTDHTLEEIGQLFGVTRERVRQIEARALRKLRNASAERELDQPAA